MTASATLLDQILGAFVATQVNVADLPGDDPTAKLGKVCEGLFTDGVNTLRSIIPNERVRALARIVWDLVGHKRVLVALGPDVPTLSFTAVRQGDMIQGLVVLPKQWPQMVEDDPFMQLGAILFVGAQVVDFYNDRLFGDPGARSRWQAYEAELLITLGRTLPSWKPNDYQRQILEKFSAGLDSAGIGLYPMKSYEPPKGDA